MRKNKYIISFILFTGVGFLFFMGGKASAIPGNSGLEPEGNRPAITVYPGAECTEEYIHLLKGKNVALVVNQTSLINKTHLVDTFLKLNVKIKKIFAPEHGFRGDHSAGAKVKTNVDPQTNLPVLSLYGDHKKPTQKDLEDVDMVIFDIQDVGVRFYTYISTMHYVMEACAENKKEFMVLDRPNPNGYYVDGPILDMKFRSFVGMHPVPLVHGMTIGEYAGMINGEKWLKDSAVCKLKVVKVKNYDHQTYYQLPVRPSPNLPTMRSIYLYPSLGLFEGTNVSVGRGTETPFEVVGRPGLPQGSHRFTPVSIPGVADNPPYEGKQCTGFLLTEFADNYLVNSRRIYLHWLKLFYEEESKKESFFNSFFDKLVGTDELRKQVIANKSVEEIYASWAPGLSQFKNTRRKYLLYKDFKE